jgi:hypothetical protein
MVELDWQVERGAGVALVELVVRNPADAARRVRVGNRLPGPVWPPRREGVPAAGWDDGGFEGVVAARDRRALGYASPVPTDESDRNPEAVDIDTADHDPVGDPPAELVWSERAGASASETDDFADEATPEGVVRALGDPRPPADAVPAAEATGERDGPPADAPVSEPPPPDAVVPEPVDAWLSAVEARADDESEPPTPTLADRAALGAVAARIETLRNADRPQRPPSDSAGRSP